MSFNPGDVIISKAMLGGEFGSVDIARKIRRLSVFHSIQKPYSTVEATIQDDTDILNNSVGLIGNNTFSVMFSQPGQMPYEGNWVLTSIEKGEPLQNQRTAIYNVTGYSPHMLKLEKVQRSFRHVTMTDAISQIVNQVLSPNKPFNILAPARNLTGNRHMPYNINGVQVFKAIRQLMLGAASSVDESSAYVMYETHKGLILDTLEHMLTRVGQGPTYYRRPMGMNLAVDLALQQFNIIAYREDSRADKSDSIEGDNQSTRVFDIFSNVFQAIPFGSGAPATFASLAYNSMRVASFAQDFMAKRRKIAGQFDSQSITAQVPLNSELDVGEGVNVELMAPLGDTNDPHPAKISGPLIITELRHTLDMMQRGMKALSTFKGCKGPTLGFL